MANKVKEFIKKNKILLLFIRKIKYSIIKTDNLKIKINNLFLNLPHSLETYNNKPKIDNLIVSLTSFPIRIDYIEYTLFSLINQNIRPAKIILWLSEDEFPNKENDISDTIKRYFPFNLEIKFVKYNIKSYKKLIYAMLQFQDYIIVTADDDVFYKKNWLNLLYDTHIKYPENIIAHIARKISFKNGKINSYLKWKNNTKGASKFNFAIGKGGILYPPNCLYKDVTNFSLFQKLCPTADDIWFYVMELLSNRKVRIISKIFNSNQISSFDYQFDGKYENVPQLTNINWNNNNNNLQLEAALKHYDLFKNFHKFLLTEDNHA